MKTMPFGKYRDMPLKNVPIKYLKWLIENMDSEDPYRPAILQEYHRRLNEENA